MASTEDYHQPFTTICKLINSLGPPQGAQSSHLISRKVIFDRTNTFFTYRTYYIVITTTFLIVYVEELDRKSVV